MDINDDSRKSISRIDKVNGKYYAIITYSSYTRLGKVDEVYFKMYDLLIWRKSLRGMDWVSQIHGYPLYDAEKSRIIGFKLEDMMTDPKRRDAGYGSIMLNEFIACAKDFGAKYITGFLSSKDIGTKESATQEQMENRERVYHFYKKHGFDISQDEEPKIRLELQYPDNAE